MQKTTSLQTQPSQQHQSPHTPISKHTQTHTSPPNPSHSPKEFDSLNSTIDFLLQILNPHTIILLRGDLASGKTTLVQNLASQIGISSSITSPTFGIQNIHPSSLHTLFHYDLYRLPLSEALELGLLEMFDSKGWHFVEWGDERLEEILKQSGFDMIIITISKMQENRIYRIS